jgi:hypothetical protein
MAAGRSGGGGGKEGSDMATVGGLGMGRLLDRLVGT